MAKLNYGKRFASTRHQTSLRYGTVSPGIPVAFKRMSKLKRILSGAKSAGLSKRAKASVTLPTVNLPP